jgi:hypothetical protein
MADENTRHNFEKQELQLTIEKLQGENDRLATEIEELSGDKAPRTAVQVVQGAGVRQRHYVASR